MRETKFIDQNKKKWQAFEQVMAGQYQDPDKLNDLFVHITDDLSYSRTFYPNRSVRVYLNGLAQRIFFSIYKNKHSPLGRFSAFWTSDLPRLVYEARIDFRISFFVFFISFMIGAVSCVMDPEFAEVILGEEYISMTQENIKSGDPMAVYKQKGALGMSLGITFNNLYVAFLTFVLGVFFSVGALVMIVRNAIMVGAFQYFFVEQGLFLESFLTIWVHGTLEISAIIIAGAAGITMGRGIVFPGTYTRLQAFQRSARRGVKIMVGIIPIIILAGFIEGYLTRHNDTSPLLRGVFILVCLLFVLVYFVWYPQYHAKTASKQGLKETRLPPDNNRAIDFHAIFTAGEVFSLVFIFLKKHFSCFSVIALGTSMLCVASLFLLNDAKPADVLNYQSGLFESLAILDELLTVKLSLAIPLVNTIAFGILGFVVLRRLSKEEQAGIVFGSKQSFYQFLNVLCVSAVFALMIGINQWHTIFTFFFLSGIILLWMQVNYREMLNPLAGINRTFVLLRMGYGRILSLMALLTLLGLIFMTLLDTAITWFFFELLGWVVNFEQGIMDDISVIGLTFFNVYFLHLVVMMLVAGLGLSYYSLLEIAEAPTLRAQIKQLGQRHMIKGIEKE